MAHLRFDARLGIYTCDGCREQIEVPERVSMDPEAHAELRERLLTRHRQCSPLRGLAALAWPRGDDGRAAESAAKTARLAS